jgi:hypothetical protein
MRSVLVGSIAGLLAVLVLTGTVYAVSAAPEMDPGGALTAISLLVGLAALAAERLRRR